MANDQILDILHKDFEELTRGELQFLRNKIRSEIRLDANVPINDDKLLNGYLVLKRKLCPNLDVYCFQSKPAMCDFGPPYGVIKRYPKLKIPVFDGLLGALTGDYIMVGEEGVSLPVLTVFYNVMVPYVVVMDTCGGFAQLSSNTVVSEIF